VRDLWDVVRDRLPLLCSMRAAIAIEIDLAVTP
jgi:hypothetical protein